MERLYSIFSFEVGDGSSLVFTKLDFWLFFLLVMVLFSFLHKNKLVRSIFLTVVSVFFFYKTSGLYVLLLGLSITVNYFLGKKIYTAPNDVKRKWIIAFSAIFNVLILGYFKYAYFFTDSFNAMFHTDYDLVNHFAQFGNGIFGDGTFVEKILLPVGVSFFTFQNISYVVDIYRKEIKPVYNFFDYTFFVTFFPQLVMGPIVRARDFIPQIQAPYSLSKEDFSWAIIQIVKGLIKKIVIADFILMHFIDIIVFAPDTYPGFVSVLAMWAYSLHIYADFSGYTDVAIGLSCLMGFRLKPNFNSPYKARNVADFWRRWHISLGSWLRDYLYIPLGGNRTGTIGSYIAIFIIFTFLIFITQWYELLYVYAGLTVVYLIGVATITNFKKYVHRDLNLLITMVVGGLWHGPSQNFVIWGAMNGCALLIFKYWKDINEYLTSKSSLWYLTKGVLAFGIYSLLNIIFPATKHEALPYFFYFWMATSALAFIYHSLTLKSAYHEHGKKVYTVFWQIFITFNFITLTRIWFKLDEADSDTLPLVMLNQMWNHFDFSWDLFVTVLKTYDKVFWVMLFGFIIHWLPDKIKLLWEKAFTALSLPLQVVAVAIIVVLIYQALGAEQPPFVYLQF